VPSEVEAAWLHHRFSQIHPFADGNGRVARAIASLVFIKAGWFPLIVKREDWARYIEALEKADDDDLRPLVALFVEAQRTALIQATEIAYDVRPITTADEAIAAVRDRLQQRGRLPLREWVRAKETAHKLVEAALQRLSQVVHQLHQEISSIGRGFQFQTGRGHPGISVDPGPVIQRAGHIADLAEYGQLLHLFLNTGRTEALLFSFHAIGPPFRGLIGVVAFLTDAGAGPTLIEGGTFQINYEEDLASAQT